MASLTDDVPPPPPPPPPPSPSPPAPPPRSLPTVAVLTAYYNFDRAQWMCPNLRFAVRNWKRDPVVHVTVVELALHGEPFELSREHAQCDALLQVHVPDAMEYKGLALNLALECAPSSCVYVAWLDNDVFFTAAATRTWAAEAARALNAAEDGGRGRTPMWAHHLCSSVTLLSEARSAAVLDTDNDAPDHEAGAHPPLVGPRRHSVYDRSAPSSETRTLIGTAWIASAALVRSARFFEAAYFGGGAALAWVLWHESARPPGGGDRHVVQTLQATARTLAAYLGPHSSYKARVRQYRHRLQQLVGTRANRRQQRGYAGRRRAAAEDEPTSRLHIGLSPAARAMGHLYHGVTDRGLARRLALAHEAGFDLATDAQLGRVPGHPTVPVWSDRLRGRLGDRLFKAMARVKCSSREEREALERLYEQAAALCTSLRELLRAELGAAARARAARDARCNELNMHLKGARAAVAHCATPSNSN